MKKSIVWTMAFACAVCVHAGIDPVKLVEDGIAAGKTAVTIPCGDYTLDLAAEKTTYFKFVGKHDLTIDFSGSKLWGEVNTRMFDLVGCTNVTIKNVTVDYPFSLPYTQAKILAVDKDRNWEVEIIDGYPVPSAAQIAPNARIWPVQVYSSDGKTLVNPMRFRNGIKIEHLYDRRYRVSGGIDRRGEVGDIAVWSLGEYSRKTENCAFLLTACTGCTLENCTVYATPMGCGFAELAADRNTYRGCKLTRCPPTKDPVTRGVKRMRSGNHDAFNSRRSFTGPLIENCCFAFHCDDDVNISGYFALVTGQNGRNLRVCPFGGLVPCAVGDSCQVMTASGERPADVSVMGCKDEGVLSPDDRAFIDSFYLYPGVKETISRVYEVTIDRDIDLPRGSVIISNRRQGNGFVIRDSDFGPNRARGLLIKASDGIIENNRIGGVEGNPVMIAPEVQWLEGGISSDLKIIGNKMKANGGGVLIAGNNMMNNPLPFGAHRNIVLEHNTVESPSAALKAVGCSGLVLKDNCFKSGKGEPVELVNCGSVGADWISAVNQKIAGEAEKKLERAADGTSWFAKEFSLDEKPIKARIAASGLGVFELYVNGKPVGNDFLKPGFTHYAKTKYSFEYDVREFLKPGKNVIAAEVSSGWWRDKIVDYKGEKSAFWCRLEMVGKNGEVTLVGTDASWRASVAGAVTHAGIFDGEEYDARIGQPVFGDDSWPMAERNDEFKGEVLPTQGAEVTLRRDLAVSRGPFHLKRGEKLVVDFGQNMAAVPEFTFASECGARLTFLPGEMLNDADEGVRGCDGPSGTVYRANLRIPESGMRLVYTFADEKQVTYHPRFTYFGFRYAEVSASEDVEIASVTAIPVSSVKPEMEIGEIETGDESLNRFISNVRWGMLSNYLSVPTDCPQRNERLGWTADTQVFADAGAFLADTRRFMGKWMRDERDTQSAFGGFPGVAPYAQYGSRPMKEMMRIGWADAPVIVAWKIWRQFDDRKIVDDNWSAMEKFMNHVAETRYAHAEIAGECGNIQNADWLSWEKYETCSGGRSGCDAIVTSGEDWRPTREAVRYWDFLGACYWLMDARMMLEMAKGTRRDETKWLAMIDEARKYLEREFIDPKTGRVIDILDDMQTPALLLLKLGVLDGAAYEETAAALRVSLEKNGNLTGFLGSSVLMDVICDNGMEDVAVGLLLNHNFPSWLYSVDQGATTVWERWNGWTKEAGFGPVAMNSYNHYAYGAVLGWMFRRLAGIAPCSSSPGFKRIVMKPIFDRRLGYVKAQYKSASGLIRSEWRYEGEKVIWSFTVPEGAVAEIEAPGMAVREFSGGIYTLDFDKPD